jgi:hypothetical protein
MEQREAFDNSIAAAAEDWLSDGGDVSEVQVRSAFARAWLVAYCPADRFETLVAAAQVAQGRQT